MDRTNILAAHDDRTVVGWFDYQRAGRWDDRDYNGNGSRGTGRGAGVVLTAGGKWLGLQWTSWQDEEWTHVYITPDEARDWLIASHEDQVVEEHFGEIPDEEDRRPGRPQIGIPVQVRLGDELARVDAYAAANGIKRAEAIRRLIGESLARGTDPQEVS